VANPQTSDLQRILLKGDPFPSTPPSNPAEAVWAGFPDLKRQLDGLFVQALTSTRTQVVLNRGDYGSGKTHAAVYFRDKRHLPSARGKAVVEDTCIVYVQTPKEQERASELLYRNIIERIRFRNIRSAVRNTINDLGSDEALEKLQEVTESDVLGTAIWLLGLQDRISQKLYEDGEGVSKWQTLLESYFYSSATRSDLRELGLSRGISGMEDRWRVLGGMLNCLVRFTDPNDIPNHVRLILWVDELEDLIYYTSKNFRPFTERLRELIDRLPAYFTLFLNITLASPEAFEDMGTILGRALLDRVTDQVYFKEPDEEGAYDYVRDLLQQFRIRHPRVRELPDVYPFEEEALRFLISTLPVRTPRDLNQRCSATIHEALQRNIFTAPGQGSIDLEFVRALTERWSQEEMGS